MGCWKHSVSGTELLSWSADTCENHWGVDLGSVHFMHFTIYRYKLPPKESC